MCSTAYLGIGVTNIVVAFMSLPFPTPRAAGAASNQSAAAQQSRAAAAAKLTHSINTADAPAELNPFGALLSPLLATAGITTWPLLRLYAVFYVWFLFYCATEIGCGHQQLSHGVPGCSHSSHSLYSCARCLCRTDLDRCGSELTCTSVCCVLCAVCCVTRGRFSAWVSPYATLVGLASEADAALLTTVYYGTFTVTRVLAAPLSAVLSSRNTLWFSMAGSMFSLLLMLLLLPFGEKAVSVLWIGAALFGAFEGPLWPAMLSLLSEEYGLELRATQTAMVLVMAKFGIFSECAPARLHLPVSLSVSICQTFVSAVRVAYVVAGRLSSRRYSRRSPRHSSSSRRSSQSCSAAHRY